MSNNKITDATKTTNVYGSRFSQRAINLLLGIVLFTTSMNAEGIHAVEHESDSMVESTEAQEIAQKFCPVRMDEAILPEIFSDYEGERVYFCCYSCRKHFAADPAKYLGNLPQFFGMVVDEHHDHGTGHDHTTGHGQPEGWGRAVRFLGKFHPLVVHFPIALILVAALGEILVLVTRKSFFTHATRFCLMIAALAAVVTVALGWAAGTFATYTGQLAETLTFHRWLGTASGVFIIIVTILSETVQRKNHQPLKIGYRIALFMTAGLVGATGHFGAMLIFGWNHFVW